MTDPERFRLTLYLHGRAALDGWWGSEGAALDKFRELVGSHGRPGATVVLIDREDGGRVVASWPGEA